MGGIQWKEWRYLVQPQGSRLGQKRGICFQLGYVILIAFQSVQGGGKLVHNVLKANVSLRSPNFPMWNAKMDSSRISLGKFSSQNVVKLK